MSHQKQLSALWIQVNKPDENCPTTTARSGWQDKATTLAFLGTWWTVIFSLLNKNNQGTCQCSNDGYIQRYCKLAWLVHTANYQPNKWRRQWHKADTRATNSRPVAQYHDSSPLNQCDRYSTGNHTFDSKHCYTKVAFIPKFDASAHIAIGKLSS